MPEPVRLTVLSDMAGTLASEQARQAAAWKLRTLDLKTINGKNVADLTEDEAKTVAGALSEHSIDVEAFSTQLFGLEIEAGPAGFQSHAARLDHALRIANHLRPRVIRLVTAHTKRRVELIDSIAYVRQASPWLLPMYADAVDRIHTAGFATVIENESAGSLFARPEEVSAFFDSLGRSEKVRFTWDVQNMWQLGTFPTLQVYRALRPYIGYLHLKGGVAAPNSTTLKWRSGVAAASWPVLDIVRAAITDGLCPAICINPSHGQPHADYPADDYGGDLTYLRQHLGSAIV